MISTKTAPPMTVPNVRARFVNWGKSAGKDYFVIQGIVYILILSLGVCLFLIDLLYPLIDPRIKYTN